MTCAVPTAPMFEGEVIVILIVIIEVAIIIVILVVVVIIVIVIVIIVIIVIVIVIIVIVVLVVVVVIIIIMMCRGWRRHGGVASLHVDQCLRGSVLEAREPLSLSLSLSLNVDVTIFTVDVKPEQRACKDDCVTCHCPPKGDPERGI